MPQRRLHVGITQHPRDLLGPGLTCRDPHVTRRHAALGPLGNDEVVVGVDGDLRQVGDHEHLSPAGHLGQRPAHPAAHHEPIAAGADLIQLITGMVFTGPGLIRAICEQYAKEASS